MKVSFIKSKISNEKIMNKENTSPLKVIQNEMFQKLEIAAL